MMKDKLYNFIVKSHEEFKKGNLTPQEHLLVDILASVEDYLSKVDAKTSEELLKMFVENKKK